MLRKCDSYNHVLNTPLGNRPLCFRTTVAGRGVLSSKTATMKRNIGLKRLSNGRYANPKTPDVVMPPPKDRFEGYFIKESESKCWEWKGAKFPNGYGVIFVNGKNISAHRFSYLTYVGKIREGLCVLHKCDNRGCVNPNHLFLGTRHDNILDASRKMRLWHGIEHWNAKLNDSKVIDAREMFCKGFSVGEISKKFCVNWKTMSSALTGKTWRHVK